MFNFAGQKILMEIAELKDIDGKKNQIVYRTRLVHDVEVAFELLLNRFGEGDLATEYPCYERLTVTMDEPHADLAPMIIIPYRALVRFYFDNPESRSIARNSFRK